MASARKPKRRTMAADPEPGRPSRAPLVIGLALVGLVAAVFGSLRHAGFLSYDDTSFVVDNGHLAAGLTWRGLVWAWTEFGEGYWPIPWMTYLAERQLFGLDAGAFHLTNVLVHTANAVLLFIALRRLTGATWRSGWVAAFFAVHPLHVEPVAWIAERNDLLSTTCWMAALWCYARFTERPSRGRMALVVVAYALGLLCKPMIITLPLGLLLLDAWPLDRWRSSPVLREKIPLAVAAIGGAVLTYVLRVRAGAVASFDLIPIGRRVGNALVSYVVYLVDTVWPHDLAVIYPYPASIPWWQVAGAAAVLVAVTTLAWRARRAAPYVFIGWLWYLVTLLPVIGLIQTGSQSHADRYTYVALTGIFIAVAWGVARISEASRAGRQAAVAAACVVLAADAVIAANQAGHWQSSEALFEHTLAVTRDNAVAHAALGTALRDAGRADEALPHLARAVILQPQSADFHINLGSALSATGQWEKALAEYRLALAVSPQSADAHSGIGAVLSRQGQREDARREFQEAIRLQPDHRDAHYNLGLLLAQMSDTDGAIRELSEAVRIAPTDALMRSDLGSMLAGAGRLDEAIVQFVEAVRLRPDVPQLKLNLDRAIALRGRGK